jgi:hypothetical protein
MAKTAVLPATKRTEEAPDAPGAPTSAAYRSRDEAAPEAAWLQALGADQARDPAVSAELVAMLAEHGLRRLPEREDLRDGLRRARRREARYLSGGTLARAALLAGDRRFLRRHGLAHLGEVVTAVNTTCHDPHEVRLVGLLAEVLTTR